MTSSMRSVSARVAGAVLLAAALGACGAETEATQPTAESTRTPQVLGAAVLDLDVGPVTDPAAIEDCLLPGFARNAESVEVLYGVEQRTADGSVPVLVLRNHDGEVQLCDVQGPDQPATLPLAEASEAEPAVFLASGRAVWDCQGKKLAGYSNTTWLAVDDSVASVRQRFWVDGVPEPWFTTRAVDGFAHLQTWLSGPLARTAEVQVEHEVLDASGEPVAQSALPAGKRSLETCAAGGGDVQIG
jgi:hypothetical protein